MSPKMDSSDARVDRASSVSSTRIKNLPPVFFASNQLNSAVRAPPTCNEPVGDGANRTRTGAILAAAIITTFPRRERLLKRHGRLAPMRAGARNAITNGVDSIVAATV